MKKHVAKLDLNRETVRNLATGDLQPVVAAVGSGRYTFCAGCSTACG
jgi:hypothetical protein